MNRMSGAWLPTLALSALLACGLLPARAEEGEGAKTEAPKKDPKDMNADEAQAAGLCPVCKQESKPVYRVEVGDKAYNFHSRDCKKTFAADPAKYGAKLSDAEKRKHDEKEKEKKTAAPPAEEKKTEDSMMGQ
ncbi:MAG: hypothetical protein M5U26_05820 [Planctomycetota bacterium]|nr:hypothetical protein [Planctomycetota bacterium]